MHVAQWSKEELVEEAVSTQGMKSQLTRQPHIKGLRGRSGIVERGVADRKARAF